jgi:hypothetical protein
MRASPISALRRYDGVVQSPTSHGQSRMDILNTLQGVIPVVFGDMRPIVALLSLVIFAVHCSLAQTSELTPRFLSLNGTCIKLRTLGISSISTSGSGGHAMESDSEHVCPCLSCQKSRRT